MLTLKALQCKPGMLGVRTDNYKMLLADKDIQLPAPHTQEENQTESQKSLVSTAKLRLLNRYTNYTKKKRNGKELRTCWGTVKRVLGF